MLYYLSAYEKTPFHLWLIVTIMPLHHIKSQILRVQKTPCPGCETLARAWGSKIEFSHKDQSGILSHNPSHPH